MASVEETFRLRFVGMDTGKKESLLRSTIPDNEQVKLPWRLFRTTIGNRDTEKQYYLAAVTVSLSSGFEST